MRLYLLKSDQIGLLLVDFGSNIRLTVFQHIERSLIAVLADVKSYQFDFLFPSLRCFCFCLSKDWSKLLYPGSS